MKETWKAVSGYEGLYQVSDLGRVRSLNYNHTGGTKILKPCNNSTGGYLFVTLCKDGKSKNMKVHRLVASAFVPNPNHLPTVNHKDEVKTNNAASNLEWMSVADNTAYSQPKQAERRVQQFDMQGNLLATFPSMAEAERATGIDRGNICKCCLGKRKFAGGFVWSYLPT